MLDRITLKDATALAIVRAVHTAVYLVMVSAIGMLWYAALAGYHGLWLIVSLALLGIEVAVVASNGMQCPLTTLSVRYGAHKGYPFDTFLPERFTQDTFWFFGTLMTLALAVLVIRALGLFG